jgi:ABC-type proline/glycine betaine transport system ATPase subunit
MAEKGKSKTNVAARAESKGKAQICRNCGNKIDVIMSVSSSGKKRMRRICCGE